MRTIITAICLALLIASCGGGRLTEAEYAEEVEGLTTALYQRVEDLSQATGVPAGDAYGAAMRDGMPGLIALRLLRRIYGLTFEQAVEVNKFIERAFHSTFCACAVVTHDVDDERVIHLADLINRRNQSANFVVRVAHEACVRFNLKKEERLFFITQ